MTEVNGLSQAALARAIGLSPAMIVKLKGRGMPVHSVEAAVAWREVNQRQYMKPEGAIKTPPPAPAPAFDDDEEVPDFRVSRARREAAEADMAEHKAAELRGALIRLEAWERAQEKKIASVRETVMQWPAQLAPVVAAETDMGRCHEILMEAAMGLLGKLSEPG